MFVACSGGGEGSGDTGGGDPPPPPPSAPWWETAGQGQDPPADNEDAARFLQQATFGPIASEMTGLNYAGFDAWFDHETSVAPSLQRARLVARAQSGLNLDNVHRQEEWWFAVVRGPDQLRQRMAFALSEILVISDEAGILAPQPLACAEYYDLLVRSAFGNYRVLLEDVTKSPAMGVYLSHLGNQKEDPVTGIRPDENYAREIMQLFTIGLIEMNPDGTPRLDGSGQEIPTYSQTDIEELARVMTGWTYGGSTRFINPQSNYLVPMESWPDFHDDGAKTIVGGTQLAAGMTPEDDLDAALDALFDHPNAGPFVSRRLIQRLVTSNPSPAYIGRVAAVFADDGNGVRGDLLAVARAILMDDEARNGHVSMPNRFGMVREPLVRLAGLWRKFNGLDAAGLIRYWNPDWDLNQAPLSAPSVFNFFEPDHAPPGVVANAGLVGPEFQITTHTSVTTVANEYGERIFFSYAGSPHVQTYTIILDISDELALANDPVVLIDHLDLFLMGGQMSNQMKQLLVAYVAGIAIDAGNKPDGTQRVLDAIYLIVTSPEGSVQL